MLVLWSFEAKMGHMICFVNCATAHNVNTSFTTKHTFKPIVMGQSYVHYKQSDGAKC